MKRFSRHFRSCFERIRDPLLIVDAEGNIRDSNGAARATLDLERGRVADAAWLDRRVAFDGAAILALLKNADAASGHRLKDPEGNDTDVVVDVIDLEGKKSGSRFKLIHVKDYSPYTNTERWKDELLSMVAHEIKNPLAAMKNSMSGLASHAAGAMTDGERSLLGVSMRSIDRLTRLLDNVLDVSRIGSGSYTPEPRWVNAREFTDEVVVAFKTLFSVRRQRVGYTVAGGLDRVYVDAPKLEQVLVNLLNNAVKFTQEGGEVTVEVEPAGLEVLGDDLRILPWDRVAELKFVRFTVTDTGIGMTEDVLSHLFTRYYRDKGRNRSRGSHLGLSISRALVEVQNGSLEFESELGVGTRARAALPADEATFTLVGRVKSIDRVLKRLVGLRRGVACGVYRKDPSVPWVRVVEGSQPGAVVNPAASEERSGITFVWTLSDRLAVGLAGGEVSGRRASAGEGGETLRRFDGYAAAGRVLAPEEARVAAVLSRALMRAGERVEVR